MTPLSFSAAYYDAFRRWGLLLAVLMGALFFKMTVIDAPEGAKPGTDFVYLWVAGDSANAGEGARVSQWPYFRDRVAAFTGEADDSYFGWHYPPLFLLAVSVLALLPYAWAWAMWVVATVAVYVYAIRHLFGHRLGYVLALGFPPVLWNAYMGQNGCLTAALIAGVVLCLDKRPWVAGLGLGLLLYKPQYGLVFPIILLAEGRWRVIAAAAVTGVVLIAASIAVYGVESWQGFMAGLPMANAALFGQGGG